MSDPAIKRVRRSIDEARNRKGMICGMPKVTIDASDAERLCILSEGLIKSTSEAGWHERQKWDAQAQAERLQSEVERLVSQNDKANNKNRELMAEVERLRGRCGELEKVVDDGSDAWLLRKQAEAVEEAYKSTVLSTKGDHPQYEKGFDDAMNQYDGQMEKYVELLRQQADEAESAGG